MNAPHDLDRQLTAFLKEGPTELPDPSFDAVRDRTERTRQRAVIGLWRTPTMNRFVTLGLAAVAVIVIAVVGYRLLGGSNVGGPGASATPQQTATPTATPAPAGLPIGSHLLLSGTPQISVIIPAPGWFGDAGGGILTKNDSVESPTGSGMITFSEPLYVYGDPCHWESTRPDTPSTTAGELATALAKQASRNASTPVEMAVGGYRGKSITLHVPDDAAYAAGKFSECDQGYFGSWTVSGEPTPARYHQSPGQIDELWIVDVNGVLVVIDTAHYVGTPATDLAELRAIAQSATFKTCDSSGGC